MIPEQKIQHVPLKIAEESGDMDSFLKAIKDPTREEHEEILEWVGKEFVPEHFDIKEISFYHPDKRREEIYRQDM